MLLTKKTVMVISFIISAYLLAMLNSSNTNATGTKELNTLSVEKFNLVAHSDNNIKNTFSKDIVWAVNLGGNTYQAKNGVTFEKEHLLGDFSQGFIETIKGSQDGALYQTYIKGNISLEKPLAAGIYDLTFLFAEPDDIAVGERVFNVLVNGKIELSAIDIRAMRDGMAFSALDKTVNNIRVDAGGLTIALQSIEGIPVISGLLVRRHRQEVQNWQLAWQDEFNYQGQPDPNKWSFDQWPARKVNDEDQVYTNRENNVRVEDGKLIIEAHKENYQNGQYTSGRIHTLAKADMLYGKIEVKAKLPAGRGTWSAIWMLPSDPYRYATSCQANEDWQGSSSCDAWPNSGEIDIMEHVGYDMHNVHGTVHNKAYYWINWQQRKGAINARNVDTEFHLYSVEWSPEQIVVLMDETPYFAYSNEHTGWRAWPFDHPYHLILNLAIGGVWGRAGGPIDDSIFPVKMEVDYVRMYTNH